MIDEFIKCGASGYTSMACHGSGRHGIANAMEVRSDQIRLEVVVPSNVCNRILDILRRQYLQAHAVTVCIETVSVLRSQNFVSEKNEEAVQKQTFR